MKRFRVFSVLAATVVTLGALVSPPTGAPSANAATTSVHFTAAGDFSATNDTRGVLDGIHASGSDLTMGLGDLSYGMTSTEQDWCDFVTARVGTTYPFQIVSGNHESNGADGSIDAFAGCLPNRLPGMQGTYGRQWFADVPAATPLVRFIMISPDLRFPDGNYGYAAGSPRYNWTATAIDGARASGVKWVVVGFHKPCLSMTSIGCDPGPDLMNLLVSKKVDLVLTGHSHIYDRSKQLSLSGACPALIPGRSSSACIADSDNTFTQGVGTVFSTVGTGGTAVEPVRTADAERNYFAAYAGNGASPTWGFLDVHVDENRLSARFVPTSGAGFTDEYTIVRPSSSNVVPVAAFSSVVSGSSVSFDASGSADPDGSVVSYAWDFGDGSVGSGVAPSHPYAAAGSYTVRLTVTDNGGATAAVTHPVSISSAPSSALGFVGAAHSDSGATRFKEAVVPASAKVGDTMVLFLTRGSAASWGAPGGVTGWTQLDSFTVGSVTSTVWKKTVAAGDPGSVVRVDASTYTKGVLSVAVYSGVSGSALGASSVARVGDAGTASHTSPGVTVPAGAWVVNYWGEKSSATTGWTAPGGVATRDTSTGTGSGRYASLLVDSGEALPAGSYPTRTATTNSTSSNSANWTITLTPSGGGGGGNVVPVAAFSSVVSGSSVSFDASGSADPDGSVVSYAWDFGDGSVGSGVAPSHPYAAAGSYTVRLTVTDNGGATAAVTHPVSISSAPSSALGFVGAAHSDSGATRFKEAVVPASAKVGDTMVLFLTRGSAASWGAPGGVTGWTQLDSFTVGSVTSTVWKKTVAAGDPGSVVRVDASTYTKGVLSVAVYSGVSGSALGASSVARVGDAGTASHTSPGVTVPAGAWVVNYWGEKSSATTGWTAPGGVATRDTSTGTGSGRYASLLVDSGEALPAGSYPTRTATTNSTSSNSANWTITLTPHN